ncbi:uncharacterized protein LOC134718555 [Mytilus trossulus]|uniref:uncharacterized protein LOC134718555 n=1 Tax=Mytilus trossulus TaxID=6551 RepID=UPI003005D28E
MTALMWSAAGGQLEITRLLLNSGCKPDITDKGGETALHWAARRGYLQTTICLVEQGGASPLVKTHEGRTPYDLAADMKKGNYKEVMEYLQVISYPMLTKLGQLNRKDFQELVALGTFASYENMVYLAGPCNIGKSSLASILICEEIPKTWLSTDGLIIHFGRNGIDLQQRKMIPLKKGSVDVLSKLLLGNPEFKKQPSLPGESQEEMSGDPNSEVTTKANSPKTSLYPSNQEHLSPKSHQETPKDFQEPPMYNARSIQDNLLEKIIKGTNIMRIAPSDLVDFGGQKSFDMTHQLFIQHRGTFILMFDGRKGLDTELEEYPQGDVTAASVLEHWINSVLTYCNKTEDEMPRIVFAATHSDSFSEDEKKILALKFSEELRDFFFYTQPS